MLIGIFIEPKNIYSPPGLKDPFLFLCKVQPHDRKINYKNKLTGLKIVVRQ